MVGKMTLESGSPSSSSGSAIYQLSDYGGNYTRYLQASTSLSIKLRITEITYRTNPEISPGPKSLTVTMIIHVFCLLRAWSCVCGARGGRGLHMYI